MDKYWEDIYRKYPEEACLLDNIEDLCRRVKTGREHPVHAIHIIEERIMHYHARKLWANEN